MRGNGWEREWRVKSWTPVAEHAPALGMCPRGEEGCAAFSPGGARGDACAKSFSFSHLTDLPASCDGIW